MSATATISPVEKATQPVGAQPKQPGATGGSKDFASLLGGRSLTDLALLGLSQSANLNLKLAGGAIPNRPADTNRPAEPDPIPDIDRSDAHSETETVPAEDRPSEVISPVASPVAEAAEDTPPLPAAEHVTRAPTSEGTEPTRLAAQRDPVSASPTPTRPTGPVELQSDRTSHGRAPAPLTAPDKVAPPAVTAKAQVIETPREPVLQTTATLSGRTAIAAQSSADKPTLNPSAESGANGLNGKPLGSALAAASTSARHAHSRAAANKGGPNAATGGPATPAPSNGASQPAQPVAHPMEFGKTLLATLARSGQSVTQQSTLQPLQTAPSGPNGLASGPMTPRTGEPPPVPRTAPPVPPRVVTNQVAVQIQKAVAQGIDRINIQLKPAELGRVEIRLDVAQDGRATAIVTAERQDTLDLLQRDARTLQAALQDAGLQADSNSLSFELHHQSLASEDEHNRTSADSDEETPAAGPAVAADGSGYVAEHRVDVRV